MEKKNRLILLYKRRTFTEKINDTFDFLRENFRQLAAWLTYLLLPVSIVLAVSMNDMMGNYAAAFGMPGRLGEELDSIVLSYLLMMVVGFLTTALGISATYGAMRLYEQRPGRLQGLGLKDLMPYIKRGTLRMLLLSLLAVPVAGVAIVVVAMMSMLLTSMSVALGLSTMLLLFMAVPLVLLPLLLAAPVYLFEDDTTVLQAFIKAWRLGWATWRGLAAVVIVLGTLVYIIIGTASLPVYILQISKFVTTSSSEVAQPSVFASMGMYLLHVVVAYISAMLSAIVYVGLAYQYGHACDKIDGAGIEQQIDSFETL